eukprot:Skav216741  [mRNA]  locus=scaffold178:124271:126382:- [translate_table: standard]
MTELLSVLQAQSPETSWFHLICSDIIHMSSYVENPSMIDAAQMQDAAFLAQYTFEHPQELNRLGKLACRVYAGYAKIWKGFRHFLKTHADEAAALGVLYTHDVNAADIPGFQLVFQCDHCEQRFATYHQLSTHALRKHNMPSLAQRYTSSNTCRACLKVYHSRAQVLHHLKYMRTGCLLHLILTRPPLDDATLELVQEEDRVAGTNARKKQRKTQHKSPMQQAAGPKPPWPWQRQLTQIRMDSRPMPCGDDRPLPFDYDAIAIAARSHDISATLNLLEGIPYHGSVASDLLGRFAQDHMDMSNPVDAEAVFTLQEAIMLWQDMNLVPVSTSTLVPRDTILFSLGQLRILPRTADPVPTSQVLRRQVIASKLWAEDHVVSNIKRLLDREHATHISQVHLIRQPFSHDPVILYVFSGRRREGDFQMQTEHFLRTTGQQGRVLMLDLALSPRHDVYQESLLTVLKSWIQAGLVIGLLIAPPCETWSEARYIEQDFAAPRPLREAANPLCIERLKLSELEQLEVSNHLLFVTIRLVFIAVCHCIPSIVEHPREPKDVHRPSIWRLPWFQELFRLKLMTQHVVFQAQFGSESVKPTHFAVGHIPRFKAVLKRFHRPVNWQSLKLLAGKTADGSWCTSRAKEYPADLNAGLSLAIVDAAKSCLREHKSLERTAQFEQEFTDLYAGDVSLEAQQMQPDFHVRVPRLDNMD